MNTVLPPPVVKIRDLEELIRAAESRKSVYCQYERMLSGPRPAAFVVNLPGFLISRLIRAGLFIYQRTPGKPCPRAKKPGKTLAEMFLDEATKAGDRA